MAQSSTLRVIGPGGDRQFNGRTHFFAAAAEAMRRILVESARRKRTLKRGGEGSRVELVDVAAPATGNVDILALHEALEELERRDPRRATLVKLRYFAGFTTQEAADALGVSRATAVNDWTFACCWLKEQIRRQD